MNPLLRVPMDLQLQLHQQALFKQEQMLSLRRRGTEDRTSSSGWPLLSLGAGPPLPREVKVELQNRELWRQFYTENTEMIITKLGRRMFPWIQLNVTGLEPRARYCLVMEVAPASDRRHKYVGGSEAARPSSRGWTSAGPAEPQPHIDRRIYLHPDSPATGAHWMQHQISFKKLKLTNNAVDHRNNVVLTSMHKYVPRIWIIRCDDTNRIRHPYFHPASSFSFSETEFIAVTAYQNEGITKLKIDNNPFAKGFRESGQSRYKRKYPEDEGEPSSRTDDEEGNVSSSESELQRSGHLEISSQRPKTASSETGSFDDSGVSSCGGASPPLPRNSPSRLEADREPQPRLHRPWLDSSPRVPSSTAISSDRIYDPFGAIGASFYAAPPAFDRLQFHSLHSQLSKFY